MEQLRIALVVPGIPKASGGPGVSVASMAGRLAGNGWKVTVLTTDQGMSEGLVPFAESVELKVFPLSGGLDTRLLRSSELIEWLERNITRFDIVDIQGIWSFITVGVARVCRRRGIAYVVTPRGQAAKWDFGKGPLRKRIFAWLWLLKAWKGASAYRFLSKQEKEDCWLPGKERGVIVSNWLEPILEVPDASLVDMRRRMRIAAEAQAILFLGRLDPQKGVLELLDAFEQLCHREESSVLLLVGPGRGAYAERVRSKVASMACSENVRLPGPVYGFEKEALLRSVAAFATLSKSEGLPMAVLEALRNGVPVVVTPGANVPEVEEYGAGFIVNDPAEAAERLGEIIRDAGLRARMGENARKLFQDRFSPDSVSPQLVALYRKICDKDKREGASAGVASRAT